MRRSPPDRLFAARVLREEAKRAGFVRFGIARAEEPPRHARFADWLAAGRHAGMRYLDETRDVRSDPRTLLPGARSVVCLAAPYAATPWIAEDGSRFARYARGSDYHGGLRARALAVVAAARTRLGDAWSARVCVDSTPLAERSFAAAAGLGWIGKNGCLIDDEHGSYLLLAEILTDLDLPADAPVAESCGTCTRCLDACPTEAFVEPGLLDAGRCIAYWTIEHRGPIPDAWKAAHRLARLRLRRLPGGLSLECASPLLPLPSLAGTPPRTAAHARRGPRDGQGRLAPAVREDRRQPRGAAGAPAQRGRLGGRDAGRGQPARPRADRGRRRARPVRGRRLGAPPARGSSLSL